jgi:Lipocalin-like domain
MIVTFPRTPKFVFAMAVLGALLVSPIPAQAQSDIVGTWKIKEFYQLVISTNEKRYIFGENPLGMLIYTKGGQFCTTVAAADRKQAGNAPTDAERVQLFTSMFSYCGTYKIEGNALTTKPLSAWVPAWIGNERKSKVEVSGNTLTSESMPFKSTRDNVDVVAITKYERVE